MTPLMVFLSYSHEEAWKDRLFGQLAVLTEEGALDVWDDRRIGAGATWEAEIRAAMDAADIAILLISKDFLTSRFVRDSEVPHLLQRRAKEGLRVIPVISVAILMNNLAGLLQATDWLAEAEPLMHRALAIAENSFGNEDSTPFRSQTGRGVVSRQSTGQTSLMFRSQRKSY